MLNHNVIHLSLKFIQSHTITTYANILGLVGKAYQILIAYIAFIIVNLLSDR